MLLSPETEGLPIAVQKASFMSTTAHHGHLLPQRESFVLGVCVLGRYKRLEIVSTWLLRRGQLLLF